MSSLDLSGKKIVLSGACGALGRVIVERLLGLGADLVATDILASEDAAKILPTANGRLSYQQCDSANEEQVAALLRPMADAPPDVVCCHAGVVGNQPVVDYGLGDFDHLMRTNVRGSFVLAQGAARMWIDRGRPGHLIFTTSWVQDVPWPEITPYTASKAAVRALTRGFARELAQKNIRANAVAPGIVAAGMALKSWNEDGGYRARAGRAIPLGYMQPPETVADAFAFLCSDMASYMTGSVLLVDGGCSLYPMD